MCLTSISLCAQGARQTTIPLLEVTIIIQQQQVRFTAPSGAQELRLEVYDQAGELTYDSGVEPGPELAWPLQKSQGQAVASGLYAYRLTIKDAAAFFWPREVNAAHCVMGWL